ncbi:MAG: pantetheine-phosphate adenylyltransferase [Chloroflexi bacterium]|nr:pantetheine-phosphate adenylyltransferase [Chloroflexota bacterium]
MRIAVYPGSFDPITNGHLDVLSRALGVFDRVAVAVLANPKKRPLLSADERIAVIRTAVDEAGLPAERVDVVGLDGLTVDAVRAYGGISIVRGLRAVSDFEAEMRLAHNNRKLAPDIDTVFFMTAVEYGYVSSSLVREIASYGGDVSGMVPAAAAAAVRIALARGEPGGRVR